jgi:hypothetical protein
MNLETFVSTLVVLSSEHAPSQRKAFRTFLNCRFIAPLNELKKLAARATLSQKFCSLLPGRMVLLANECWPRAIRGQGQEDSGTCPKTVLQTSS